MLNNKLTLRNRSKRPYQTTTSFYRKVKLLKQNNNNSGVRIFAEKEVQDIINSNHTNVRDSE